MEQRHSRKESFNFVKTISRAIKMMKSFSECNTFFRKQSQSSSLVFDGNIANVRI